DDIAMLRQPVILLVPGAQRRGQHKRDIPLAEYVTRFVPRPGFQSGIGDDVEAERIPVKVRRLTGVSYKKPNMINPTQRQDIVCHRRSLLTNSPSAVR